MIYRPIIISGPTSEPVSTEEARLHLRIDELADPTEDALQEAELSRMISAARFYLEQSTGRTFHEQTLEWVMDYWPGDYVALPRATPLLAISSLKWKDTAGNETTVDPSQYIADTDSTPGRLVRAYGISWPSTTLFPSNPIRIRYRCGVETASPVADVGAEIKMPLLLLLAGMWENRESEVVTDMKTLESLALRWGIEKYVTELMVHCH
jgi:uncharacterized phiE125 gp8 family phage protein